MDRPKKYNDNPKLPITKLWQFLRRKKHELVTKTVSRPRLDKMGKDVLHTADEQWQTRWIKSIAKLRMQKMRRGENKRSSAVAHNQGKKLCRCKKCGVNIGYFYNAEKVEMCEQCKKQLENAQTQQQLQKLTQEEISFLRSVDNRICDENLNHHWDDSTIIELEKIIHRLIGLPITKRF